MAHQEQTARDLSISRNEGPQHARTRRQYLPLAVAVLEEETPRAQDVRKRRIVAACLLGLVSIVSVLSSTKPFRVWAFSPHGGHSNLRADSTDKAVQLRALETGTDLAKLPGNTNVEQALLDSAYDLLGVAQQHSLWEVATDGPVLVRREPSLRSKAFGAKQPGTVILGVRHGEYIRLIKEAGYMKLALKVPNVTLLRPVDIAFKEILGQTCSDAGDFPIGEELKCQAAAVALGMAYTSVRLDDEAGCVLKSSIPVRSSLCCIKSCPPPATSTSTATTTTSTTLQSTSSKSTTVTTTTRLASTEMPTTTVATATPSLFCFAVIRAQSSETLLLRSAYRLSLSIFGCNKWAVYSDIATWLATPDRNDTIAIPGPPAKYNGLWLNCPVFFRAWERLLASKEFEETEWTVKVDPDAVFIPSRLRSQFQQQAFSGWNKKVYFKNCQQFGSMQGPLEIFSRGAVFAFAAGFEDCKDGISQSSIGEDGFMQQCMEKLQVTAVDEFTILEDLYCGVTFYGQEIFPCSNTARVAYHPFKTEAAYSKCLRQSGVLYD